MGGVFASLLCGLSALHRFRSVSSQPKIGDFGLLREMDSSSSQMNVTAVVGTPGYVDPAYVQSQYSTPSADVYRCVGVLQVSSTGAMKNCNACVQQSSRASTHMERVNTHAC